MISKIWSGIMLKLARLIVKLDTARDAISQTRSLAKEIKEAHRCRQL